MKNTKNWINHTPPIVKIQSLRTKFRRKLISSELFPENIYASQFVRKLCLIMHEMNSSAKSKS